jgi:hypothetical protein
MLNVLIIRGGGFDIAVIAFRGDILKMRVTGNLVREGKGLLIQGGILQRRDEVLALFDEVLVIHMKIL